ncbi:MAG: hypothetical protein ACYTEG_16295, partial [Planctomycetota bacterium]
MKHRALVAAILTLVAYAGNRPVDKAGFWTKDELRRIDEGLAVVNASRADLGFEKQPIDDPFRLDVVRRALDDPLSVGRTASEWDRIARRGDASDIVGWARQYALDAPPPRHPPNIAEPFNWPGSVPKGLVGPLENVLATAQPEPVPQDLLRKALLSQVGKPSKPVDAPDLDDAAFLARARKVDRAWLHADTAELVAAVAVLVRTLRELPFEQKTGKPLRIETPDGVLLIYGEGDDLHPADESAKLVIDLGGDDTYR